MPELPEVEVLVRHLEPLLVGKRVKTVHVSRAKSIAPSTDRQLSQALVGSVFKGVTRRAKYLVFSLRRPGTKEPLQVVGHLGMTGRMYLLRRQTLLPKHAAVVLGLGREQFVFEDTRYFGRFTLDTSPLARLGPEPLDESFTPEKFACALRRSGQPIKVRLLDQSVVAGVGNIYASEALFRAGISPRARSATLRQEQVLSLWKAIREVLSQAIEWGSTVPLDFPGAGDRDKLFYYGQKPGTPDFYEERLEVYDREGLPCRNCGSPIRRVAQGGRSTFYCARCQPSRRLMSRAVTPISFLPRAG